MNPEFYLMLLTFLLFVVFLLITLWEKIKTPDIVLIVSVTVIIAIMLYSDQYKFEHALVVNFFKLAILANIVAIIQKVYLVIKAKKGKK